MTPRHDGKVSARFPDIDFYNEWDVDQLPWYAATPVDVGSEPPEALDTALVDALHQILTKEDVNAKGKSAALAFLYLYMILANGSDR
jgi:hypothetical protein